jgi:hypothetical protein
MPTKYSALTDLSSYLERHHKQNHFFVLRDSRQFVVVAKQSIRIEAEVIVRWPKVLMSLRSHNMSSLHDPSSNIPLMGFHGHFPRIKGDIGGTSTW